MYRYRIPGIPTPSKQASRHFLRLPFAFRLQSLPAKSFASLNLDFGGKFPPLTLASLTSHYNNNISRESDTHYYRTATGPATPTTT